MSLARRAASLWAHEGLHESLTSSEEELPMHVGRDSKKPSSYTADTSCEREINSIFIYRNDTSYDKSDF
jgi:hypothetical protein